MSTAQLRIIVAGKTRDVMQIMDDDDAHVIASHVVETEFTERAVVVAERGNVSWIVKRHVVTTQFGVSHGRWEDAR